VHRDHVYAIIIQPISTNKTKEHVSIYYAQKPEEMSSLSALVDANAKFWKMVFLEDVGVVEGMQSGRHGLLFDGGKFSPAMDGPTHCFHHWVATQVNQFRQ
jgi:phenylpropionate dioxygenase-like ring-hydroxylating dioxygenase large terminal subunit